MEKQMQFFIFLTSIHYQSKFVEESNSVYMNTFGLTPLLICSLITLVNLLH